MNFKAVFVLLLVRTVAPVTGNSIGLTSRNYELVANGSILIDGSLNCSLLNESGIRSEGECLAKCEQRGCIVAVVNELRQVCHLAVIKDIPADRQRPGDSNSTNLLLTANGTTRLWKTDFKMPSIPSVFHEFRNSSTGKLGVVRNLTINFTGCYHIEAFGASGGSVLSAVAIRAGRGASAAGSFLLSAGTRLEIVVGQAGEPTTCNCGTGGGGGSFVYASNDSPRLLLAAGGGGGMGSTRSGMDGSSGTNGTASNTPDPFYIGWGGNDGQPGQVAINQNSDALVPIGGPGAGWNGTGIQSSVTYSGLAGLSRSGGWLGGDKRFDCSTGDGGFGGGGAGGGSCVTSKYGSAGGGGGFSGGGTGSTVDSGGGGGGSFCSGFGCVTTAGANLELHGRVVLNSTGAVCV